MPNLSIQPNENVTYKIAHQDEHLMVVVKPARVVTTPGLGHETTSLLSGLFARVGPKLQQLGASRDFGLLHRLDRMTSGLVLVALRTDTYDALRAAFEKREVAKFYWAVVEGTPKHPEGVIRLPIAEYQGKVPGDTRAKKLAKISSAGQDAVTAYRVLQAAPAASLLECRVITGKLHQVRVHLEAKGWPILGDDFYAKSGVRDAAPRLALHAHRLVLTHPATGKTLDVRSAFPEDLRGLLKRLSLRRPDLAPAPGKPAAGEPTTSEPEPPEPASGHGAKELHDDRVRDEEA